MALSTLQKLLRKSPPPTRILASFQNPLIHSPKPTDPFLLHHQTSHLETKQSENKTVKRNTFLGSYKVENLTQLDPLLFSPVHPIGSFSYPILSPGSVQDRSNEDGSGMWADSVKKKRKKKMNKHKYQKLRKRLRRRS